MLTRSRIEQLLDSGGLEPRRSLGQNFVADPSVIDSIVERSGVRAGDRVLEVGPGLGSLTVALASAGAEVLALEKDRSLAGVLAAVLRDEGLEDRVEIVLGDALEVDLGSLLAGSGTGQSWTLVANLPYNVAVPIVLRLLEEAPEVSSMVVMVQREVAERLCAQPGGRTIGMPTLRLNWHATATMVMEVGPEAFVPEPRVDSAVVRVDRTGSRREADPDAVLALADRAYRKRRKMLRSSLPELDGAMFERAGIDPTSRPEELSVQQWVDLAVSVAAAGGVARTRDTP